VIEAHSDNDGRVCSTCPMPPDVSDAGRERADGIARKAYGVYSEWRRGPKKPEGYNEARLDFFSKLSAAETRGPANHKYGGVSGRSDLFEDLCIFQAMVIRSMGRDYSVVATYVPAHQGWVRIGGKADSWETFEHRHEPAGVPAHYVVRLVVSE